MDFFCVSLSFESSIAHCKSRLTSVVGMQLTNALRDHAFVDLDAKHLFCDAVVSQLGKEIENGRLLRLLIKLSTITERADTDAQWAETGKPESR